MIGSFLPRGVHDAYRKKPNSWMGFNRSHPDLERCIALLPFFELSYAEGASDVENLFGAYANVTMPTESGFTANGTDSDGTVFKSSSGRPALCQTGDYAELDCSEITVFAWINYTDTGSFQFPASRDDSSGNRSWALFIDSGDDPGFYVFANSGAGFAQADPANSAVPAGVPVCLTGTYDQSTVAVYRDGVLEDTAAMSGAPLALDPAAIGISVNARGTGEATTMDVYQVRVYDYAMTQAEVQRITMQPWAPWESYRPFDVPAAAAAGAPYYSGLSLMGVGA